MEKEIEEAEDWERGKIGDRRQSLSYRLRGNSGAGKRGSGALRKPRDSRMMKKDSESPTRGLL